MRIKYAFIHRFNRLKDPSKSQQGIGHRYRVSVKMNISKNSQFRMGTLGVDRVYLGCPESDS